MGAPGHHHQLRPVTQLTQVTGARGHPPWPVVQPGFVPQQVLCHLAMETKLPDINQAIMAWSDWTQKIGNMSWLSWLQR